jgi:hypothetical protein
VGALAVVAAVLVLVMTAFAANAPVVGGRIAELVCEFVTAGQGQCGGSAPDGEARQPTASCVVRGDGDSMEGTVSVTFVELGGNRSFMKETRSDGTYKITQGVGGDASATAGVGASTSFTVNGNNVGTGASAGVSGGVTFSGGREWIVDSEAEADRLTSAEYWDRFDDLVGTTNPLVGPGLPWVRDKLGIGEVLPPPDRVYVAAGVSGEASAYAGAGPAVADASAGVTRLLGFSTSPGSGEREVYIETEVTGDAAAGLALGVDTAGGELSGQVKVLTTVTMDADGRLTKVSRSALSTGSSAGLTNALFGGGFAPLTSEQVGTGTQWEATLPISSDADRVAALSLLASTGVNPLGIGVRDDPGGFRPDPLGASFTDAVRDRGELTRHTVTTDESILLAGSGEVAVGPKLGLGGSYSNETMTAADHQYWDGNRFASRTNC